jgi:hypothetical protein
MFASQNAFRQVTLSRKDDLISLVYLMCYLLNNNKIYWFDKLNDTQKIFYMIRKAKIKMTPIKLCEGNAVPLLHLAKEVFA